MENSKDKSRGKVTVGYGTNLQNEIEIIDFVRCDFKDYRLISVATLENEQGYIISVENPTTTDRCPIQTMWLSRESFAGLIGAAFMFWSAKGEDMLTLMKDCTIKNKIKYSCSDNLNPKKEISKLKKK